jgi:hypothetical protein
MYWGQLVRIRDGHCQQCGSGFDLEAHHVIAKCRRPPFQVLTDPDFGITLCRQCHQERPGNPDKWPDRWNDTVLQRLFNLMPPARAAKVQEFLLRPWYDISAKRPWAETARALKKAVDNARRTDAYEPESLRAYYC